MTLDPEVLREAQDILRMYSTPAQELIKQNLYGPREARLAGAIVANNFTTVVHHEPTESEAFKTWQAHAWEQIKRFCTLLHKTTAIVEELAGHDELLKACASAIATAEEDFEVYSANTDKPKQEVTRER